MAGSSRRIVIEFLGKDKTLGSTASSIEGKTSRLGSTLGKVGRMAAVGLAAGAAAGGVALFKMGQKAGDLNETISKTNEIFGSRAGKSLETWAKSADTALGQSQQTALDAAATFGVFGKSAGKSGKDLAEFAKTNTKLATDLASFHNTSPEEAITALGAAFRGESEPMRRFGVLLDDASMRQEALKLGLVKTTKEALTPQQKVLAAQALIMKQTGDAQGDFARTSGGLANQQRMLSAQFENMQVSVGEKVLPVLLKLATFANTTLIPALGRVGAWVEDNVLPPLQAAGAWIQSNLIPVFQRFGSEGPGAFDRLRSAVAPVVDAVRGMIAVVAPIVQQVVAVIRANWGPISAWARENFGQVRQTVSMALELIAVRIKMVTAVIRAVWSRWGEDILAVAVRVFRAIGQVISGALSIIRGIVKTALSILKGDWSGAWDGIKTILSGAWKVIRAAVSLHMDLMKAAISKGLGLIVGQMKALPGKILAALGNLGSLLWNAGASIMQGLIDGIQAKISALTAKLKEITSLIPKVKGPLDKDKILLKPAGVAIMEGLIKGIESKKHDLERVLGRVTDFIKRANDRISSLVSDRRSIMQGFSSFSSGSVFTADLGLEPNSDGSMPVNQGISALLAYQLEQKAKAERLRADTRKLIKKGLSESLIRQMAAAGESGLEQIHTLANGSERDIARFNQLNAQTNKALRGAGAAAGNALFSDDIAEARKNKATAQAIAKELRAALREKDEDTKVMLILDGKVLQTSLLKLKRKNGTSLGLA